MPTFLHAPITVAALERGLHVLSREADRAHGRGGRGDGRGGASGGTGARRRVQPPPARGHPDAAARRSRPGRLGQPYYAKAWWLRRTGIPTLGSLVHQRRAGGRRAAAGHRDPRARLRAVPARAAEGRRRSAPPPTTCSARPASAAAPISGKTGRRRRRSTSRTSRRAFLRLDDGGTLLVEASWAAHRTVRRRVRDHASSAPRAAPSCGWSTWSRSGR